MFYDFLKYIEDNRLFGENDRVLLAVSGGIDSMVMSHLFINAGFTTGIAHCNFSLRSDESDMDEELVRSFAAENNIQFFSKRFDTKTYAKEQGISIQMAARELRYNWFETVRREGGFDCIAVAHNLDDNIETLLINLTRGTGITGLTGMRPLSERIVRPLLFATRSRITEYCYINKIPYRDDQSNSETKYTRNKIRHLVIPVLKEINPSVEYTLNDTALKLAGTNEIATRYMDDLRKRISRVEADRVIFSIDDLLPLSDNNTILYELFRPYGLTGYLTKDLANILHGRTGSQVFTQSHRLLKNRTELIVSPVEKNRLRSFEVDNVGGFSGIPFIVSADVITMEPGLKIKGEKHVALIDFDTVRFPIVIRPWQRGDHFFPFGMSGRKKLSDYFIDRKFPVTKKESTMVLESDGKIVWIVGERLDNRFRIRQSTSKVIRIESTRM
jgi:tRNA(Ile)-lysidine synthase